MFSFLCIYTHSGLFSCVKHLLIMSVFELCEYQLEWNRSWFFRIFFGTFQFLYCWFCYGGLRRIQKNKYHSNRYSGSWVINGVTQKFCDFLLYIYIYIYMHRRTVFYSCRPMWHFFVIIHEHIFILTQDTLTVYNSFQQSYQSSSSLTKLRRCLLCNCLIA